MRAIGGALTLNGRDLQLQDSRLQAASASLTSTGGPLRLDRAALDTVMRWRYVPGKRGDVPEAMWFNVPLNFVLE